MKDSELWMEKAEDDLEAARYMVKGEKFSQAAFLFQQAAEKALKPLLVRNGEGVPQTHDLFVLAKKIDAPEDVKESANGLYPYYFRTRYPDADILELSESEMEEVNSSAEVVMEWVRKRF